MLIDATEVLRRIEDPDEEMLKALDHLRKNYYSVYCAVREVREHPERLEIWRSAKKPSQDWRKGFYLDVALRLLSTKLYNR